MRTLFVRLESAPVLIQLVEDPLARLALDGVAGIDEGAGLMVADPGGRLGHQASNSASAPERTVKRTTKANGLAPSGIRPPILAAHVVGETLRAKLRGVWYYGCMATRKMTFTLPEPLATRFAKRVPSRERSRYVADALAARLAERDRRLIRSCEAANDDAEVAQIEREFEALPDTVSEP